MNRKKIAIEDLKRYRALVETGTPLDKATVLNIIRHAGEAAETIQRKQDAVDTLDRIITTQCDAALNATGLHHLIDEDGDGDWSAVWEALAEFPDWKAKAISRGEELERSKRALESVSTLFEGMVVELSPGVSENLNGTIKATIQKVLEGDRE